MFTIPSYEPRENIAHIVEYAYVMVVCLHSFQYQFDPRAFDCPSFVVGC